MFKKTPTRECIFMIHPKRCGLLGLLWLVLASYLVAQTHPINTQIQQLITNHPSVVATRATKEALLKAVDQSQIGFNPELEMSAGHKNDGAANGLTIDTSLKQTWLYPGKQDARKALAMSHVHLQDTTTQKLKSTLANDLIIKTFQWQIDIKKQAFNQKRVQKLNWIKTYLNSRPFASPQKRLEIRLIESHLKSLQMESHKLATLAATSRFALEALIQAPISTQIDSPAVPQNIPVLANQKQALATQNPDIQALHIQIAQTDIETKNLDMEANSDIDLLGRYASESASGTDQFYSIGIGIELPFSNKNKAALHAQPYKKKALESQLAQLLKEKEAQWQTAISALTQAQATLSLYTPTWITELEASLDHAIDGFKKEQTELLSVLELESQWHAAMTTHYDAKVEEITTYTTLRQLLGKTEFSGDEL
jgi:Outer membrane efflux protein